MAGLRLARVPALANFLCCPHGTSSPLAQRVAVRQRASGPQRLLAETASSSPAYYPLRSPTCAIERLDYSRPAPCSPALRLLLCAAWAARARTTCQAPARRRITKLTKGHQGRANFLALPPLAAYTTPSPSPSPSPPPRPAPVLPPLLPPLPTRCPGPAAPASSSAAPFGKPQPAPSHPRTTTAQLPRPLPTLASHASSTPPLSLSGKPASLMSVTVHESRMMPAYASSANDLASFDFSQAIAPRSARTSSDRPPAPRERENGDGQPNGTAPRMTAKPNGPPVMQSVPNGRSAKPASFDKRRSHDDDAYSKSPPTHNTSTEPAARDDGYFASVHSSEAKDRLGTTQVKLGLVNPAEGTREARKDFMPPLEPSAPPPPPPSGDAPPNLAIPAQPHRVSSPPAFNQGSASSGPLQPPHRLQHRHTLEVPKLSASRARDAPNNTDDVVTASGRFSPTTDRRRRASMTLVRRNTRSVNSDMHLDEVPQDEDAARWAEHIRQKRASKRKRKEDEDEDRVVVGTKVDQNHVNWVTAYNMLTGIRFTVSRTNAKMDRELTDADFDAKHKFSFDMYVPSDLSDHHASSYIILTSTELATSLPLRPSTTSSSRTMLLGSSAISAPPSSWTPPTTSSLSPASTSFQSWARRARAAASSISPETTNTSSRLSITPSTSSSARYSRTTTTMYKKTQIPCFPSSTACIA